MPSWPVDGTTTHRGYQLPHPEAPSARADVERIGNALVALDVDVDTLIDGLATANTDISGKAPNARTISGGGLVSGGGDLSANRTLTVTAASNSDGETGTDTTKAMTAAATKAAIIAWAKHYAFPSGTKSLFQQTAAPTGWTKDTTHNDKALRIVSGAAGTGGSANFSSTFTSRTPAGTIGNTTSTGSVGSTTLAITQIPSHNHLNPVIGIGTGTTPGGAYTIPYPVAYMAYEGGSQSHTHSLTMNAHNHSFTGTAMDFAVAYVDVIIATKD